MRVVYHHRTQGAGVEGVHIRGVADAFRRLGHEVEVISPPGVTLVGESASPVRANRVAQRSALHRMYESVSNRFPERLFEIAEVLYNVPALVRLHRRLAAAPIDLLYERYALYLFAGVLAAWWRHVPVVLEVNDATCIERSRTLRFTRLAGWLEGRVLRGATVVVTVSGEFRRLLCERHGLSPERILVLPNAAEPDVLATPTSVAVRRQPPSHDGVVAGMVGAFVKWHGVDFLLDALAQEILRSGSLLVLVGDGPERETITARIAKWKVERNVVFTGFLSRAAALDEIRAMDICIVSDSNRHGSLMKLFEYLALGKAVLVPAYGPVAEIVTSGENGMLFRPRDAGDFVEKFRTLASDPELRTRIGRNARVSVERFHTWDHRVRDLLQRLECMPRKSECLTQTRPEAPAT